MSIFKVKVRGVKPILFHKFNIECLTDSRKPKEGSTGNNPNEWKVSFFHDGGHIYIPGAYLFAALKNGAVNTKVGRGTIQKTLISSVTIVEEKAFFNRKMWEGWQDAELTEELMDSNRDVYVDCRMVANPNTKGRNIRYRIALKAGWELDFSLLSDDSLISNAQVKKIVEDTGKLQGIADGRSLGYGRYEVVDIQVEKE